jgi:hypothetical protein
MGPAPTCPGAEDANERLNSPCYQLDVFLGAAWSGKVLHDYESMG